MRITRSAGLLVAIAALGLSVGAGSASASPWTVVDGSGNPYTGSVSIQGTLAVGQLSAGKGVTCNANLSGSITDSGALDGVPNGTISSGTWAGCVHVLGWPATVTSNNLPWSMSITGATAASLVTQGFDVTARVPARAETCRLTRASLPGSIVSGSPATVFYDWATLTQLGPNCVWVNGYLGTSTAGLTVKGSGGQNLNVI